MLMQLAKHERMRKILEGVIVACVRDDTGHVTCSDLLEKRFVGPADAIAKRFQRTPEGRCASLAQSYAKYLFPHSAPRQYCHTEADHTRTLRRRKRETPSLLAPMLVDPGRGAH